MKRADYDYQLTKYNNKIDVLAIEDLNLGNVSVTNDIENVVADISRLEKLKAEDYMIVFKDSTGHWDGWDSSKQQFVLLGMDNWYDAIELWISRKTEL